MDTARAIIISSAATQVALLLNGTLGAEEIPAEAVRVVRECTLAQMQTARETVEAFNFYRRRFYLFVGDDTLLLNCKRYADAAAV